MFYIIFWGKYGSSPTFIFLVADGEKGLETKESNLVGKKERNNHLYHIIKRLLLSVYIFLSILFFK